MSESRRLAELFERLSGVIATTAPLEDALAVVTAAAVDSIPGADAAAVTRGRPGALDTVAATSELATQVERIQYELMSGPCVDVVSGRSGFRVDDLAVEQRWPEFATRATAETAVRGVLSFRMFFEEGDLVAGLNLYATRPGAFDELAETTGLVLATHGALAFTSVLRRERIENLERALATNRDIGVAMGILMNRHLTTKQQAFDMLRVTSQRTHRKLGDIAVGVIETGQLDDPAMSSLA